MAYLFGAANSDRINASGLPAWSTKFSMFIRLKMTASSTVQRELFDPQSANTFLDFSGGGATDTLRIGYQDSASAFQLITWLTGWSAGAIHTAVATMDTTLGTNNLKLYADVDATPKAQLTTTLGPLSAGGNATIGGDATTLSADCTIYEVAWWASLALTGAQSAQLGGGTATGIPNPDDYWGFNLDTVDLFGGNNGTVTGATLVAHSGSNLWVPVMAQAIF